MSRPLPRQRLQLRCWRPKSQMSTPRTSHKVAIPKPGNAACESLHMMRRILRPGTKTPNTDVMLAHMHSSKSSKLDWDVGVPSLPDDALNLMWHATCKFCRMRWRRRWHRGCGNFATGKMLLTACWSGSTRQTRMCDWPPPRLPEQSMPLASGSAACSWWFSLR